MDYSIRKKWLIAFWASWALPIISGIASLNLVALLVFAGTMYIIYYCAYKNYGVWLLTFLLCFNYIAVSILGLALLFALLPESIAFKYLTTPLGILVVALNIYYYVCCYRLREFNRLYRQRLFAEADKLL